MLKKCIFNILIIVFVFLFWKFVVFFIRCFVNRFLVSKVEFFSLLVMVMYDGGDSSVFNFMVGGGIFLFYRFLF